jgi:GDP-mannose 6-dehydrogenase
MNISIFGLGYVGAVSCGCLAKQGHRIVGVDVSPIKVRLINEGHSPVVEPEIEELIREVVSSGQLRATHDADEAVQQTDVTFISVGTPSQANGSLDLQYVRTVCAEIGAALAKKNTFHVVVGRSTMLPGSTREAVIPALEKASGKKAGKDFAVAFNPEFLREGTSVFDFFHPPKTVIGSDHDTASAMLREIYQGLPGETFVTSVEVSEMVKYADNNFHAVKITFANEIGMICKELNIDSHAVMDIFCRDEKLNISPYYLKPGFAFGGSCLPKDVKALTYQARAMDLDTPLLHALMASNKNQIAQVVARIMQMGKKRVGFLGFSFKAGTDDLRGSPVVDVIEALLGKGFTVRLYDRNVNVARLMGANQSYVEQHIPHVAALMAETPQDVVQQSDVIVIGNKAKEFEEVIAAADPSKTVLDLVRITKGKRTGGNYIGLAW